MNIMPVEENFDCRRTRVMVHILAIQCQLNTSGWIRQLDYTLNNRDMFFAHILIDYF